MDARSQLQHRLGHRFSNQDLLDRALTHRSSVGPDGRVTSNERLEFLGDRVLGLTVADLLYRAFPEEDEGGLAKRLAALVSGKTLSQVAADLELSPLLVLGPNDTLPPSGMNAMSANACEAIIGAIFLDAGFETAQACVVRLWEPLVHSVVEPPKDAKTALQEWAQAQGLPLPEYRVVTTSGPDHAPAFKMAVHVQGREPTEGSGPSKREAAQAAAAAMLAQLQ